MTTKISNVRVFKGQSFSEPSDVYFKDAKILDIQLANSSTGHNVANTVDGSSGFLIPGLIDAHVHVVQHKTLHIAAKNGITTVLDMGLFPDPVNKLAELRKASQGLTDVQSAHTAATAPGSVHSRMPQMPDESLVANVEQARAFVAKHVEEKSDYIKMIADVPVGPSQEVLDTIAEESHKAGKLVVAHAARKGAYEMAIRSGADILTHVPIDAPLTEEMGREMKERGVACCPTLIMMQGVSKVVPKSSYEVAKESMAVLLKAGVTMLAGTDANDTKMSPVPLGDSIHTELKLMVEAGMTTEEVLWAVTEGPANVFRMPDRGRVEVGMRSDLVLLDADPLEDIESSRHIKGVWCAGNQVEIK